MKKAEKINKINAIMEDMFSIKREHTNEEYAAYFVAQCNKLTSSDLDDVVEVLEEALEQNKKIMAVLDYAMNNSKNLFTRDGLNRKLLERFDID